MLTGSALSPVQARAVEMLYLLDQREKSSDFIENLRSRIAGSHPNLISSIFPDWYSDEKTPERSTEAIEKARREDGTYDIDQIDGADVDWGVPATEAERIELERWINERTSGTVSAADLEEGGGWM